MMLDEVIGKIDRLKQEWDAAQPLPTADRDRLWRKFRLEWNYNSNHIEGNTLTYGETELLLIFGQTEGGHAFREYEEMKAHDLAIDYVRELARAPQPVTEGDVRSLNKMLLKEPFWKAAATFEGEATRKQIIPGEYKTSPNNVRTATGEIFQFADPIDIPARMSALIAWLRHALESGEDDVTRIIGKLHHEFVLIHPFDDGNGRVARLLVNYVLYRLGYPPIIIKSRDKKNYLAALNRADVGDLDAFVLYLANELVWSLEVSLKAARGESIEEPDDVDKDVAIFARRHQAQAKPPEKSVELVQANARQVWIPIMQMVIEKLSPLLGVFGNAQWSVSQHLKPGIYGFSEKPCKEWSGSVQSFESGWHDVLLVYGRSQSGALVVPDRFDFLISLEGFLAEGRQVKARQSIHIQLDAFSWALSAINVDLPKLSHRYDDPVTHEKQTQLANMLVKDLLKQVQDQTQSKS